jgi:monoamine oxidase
MTPLSRRLFLAGSAAMTAGPGVAAPTPKQQPRAPADEVRPGGDVIIVGAGAAGIAAARRLTAAGRSFTLIEAADKIGGRCITDTTTFGVPYDRGAHWIHMPEINPVARLAPRTGLDIYPAPPGQRVRIGQRYAREGEMEDFLAGLVQANTAIAAAARGRTDVSCGQALPKDLGEWRSTIEFFLGPFGCGKDLADISVADFTRSVERDVDAFCRQGFGALLARLATDIPVALSTPATRIDYGTRTVTVSTPNGRLTAPTAIVTASTNVLAGSVIKFSPDLPRRHVDAIGKLRLGSYDHITLEIPNNPFGLAADEMVFERSTGPRTASLFANASGTTLCMIDVAGKFGRDLSAKGEAAMIAFALDWLVTIYGPEARDLVKRRHATRWNFEPYVLGAFSAAAPGGQGARKVLMEPLNNRVFLAGEAAHETLWGTVGGAWESGERAADAAVKLLAGPVGR